VVDTPADAPAAQPLPPPPPPPGEKTPPFGELFQLPPDATDIVIQDVVNRHVQWILDRHPIAADHNVLFLFPLVSIGRSDANRIYTAVTALQQPEKPLLLIVNTTGGDVASAYFISKLCRQSTKAAFKVAVAQQAKSAATLICCGADQIHMGGLSELGPIDPQLGKIPALALKHSIEHLAQLATQYPKARDMFSEYLSKSLNIEALGFYERVAESAKQYAERLLRGRRDLEQTPEEIEAIARRLVYTYKDHNFVIDLAEATDIFGAHVVRSDSDEYRAANQLYPSLDVMGWVIESTFKKNMSFVGSAQTGACWVTDKRSTA